MAKWDSPRDQTLQYASYTNLESVLAGICIWEFTTTLAFKYRLLRNSKRRSRSYVKWIYLACQCTLLGSSINFLLGASIMSKINCKIWVKYSSAESYLVTIFSTSLIGFRVIAIWDRNVLAIALTILASLAQLATGIFAVVTVDSQRIAPGVCTILHERADVASLTATFTFDVILLICMFAGLHRNRVASRYKLWQVLWNQGLIWVAFAVAIEVPSVAIIYLDIDVPMDLIFLAPMSVFLAIGAMRLYRSLYEFSQNHQPTGLVDSRGASNWTPMMPISFGFRRSVEHSMSVESSYAPTGIGGMNGGNSGITKSVGRGGRDIR